MPDTPETTLPGPDLQKAVKIGFIQQNTTFTAWCKKHQLNRANASMALLGGWRGPKARKLVAKIKRAAGVQ